ncbi:unnamed protein product, partial [marine sediment metagenome]
KSVMSIPTDSSITILLLSSPQRVTNLEEIQTPRVKRIIINERYVNGDFSKNQIRIHTMIEAAVAGARGIYPIPRRVPAIE